VRIKPEGSTAMLPRSYPILYYSTLSLVESEPGSQSKPATRTVVVVVVVVVIVSVDDDVVVVVVLVCYFMVNPN
jgi:hypothetical protein